MIPIAQHVSGNYFAHLQEHKTVCYSLWYNAPTILPAGSLEAEFLCKITARNMLS